MNTPVGFQFLERGLYLDAVGLKDCLLFELKHRENKFVVLVFWIRFHAVLPKLIENMHDRKTDSQTMQSKVSMGG